MCCCCGLDGVVLSLVTGFAQRERKVLVLYHVLGVEKMKTLECIIHFLSWEKCTNSHISNMTF